MPTHAELVTPERVLFSGEAAFVVLRTDGGEIMFLPEHADFVGAVDISLVRIAEAGAEAGREGGHAESEFRAAVHGGFVHVADNKVTLLASVAEPASEIDVDRARRALEAARAALAAGEGGGHEAQQAGAEEAAETSSAMKALLSPDDPEVALRRAEVRLEAAGASEPTGSSAPAAH
ncbi:MAG TPA: ATP synthase F1 subunit epsilon [Acidimicrobiales bacterium]|nr:ATP synthase F1 subunit epsilon [Acidimicrobiales bacterium]